MNTVKKITLRNFYISALFMLLFIGYQSQSYAIGSLVITPTRVTFDDRTRSATVTIVNTSSETTSYRARFLRKYMTEDGELLDIKEGEKGNYSDEFIRYSPRQVTLAPGQSQVIRLLLRKPRNLPAGEYRSHMLFQALPDAKESAIKLQSDANKGEISIQITSLIGITIPIIVRHGTLEAKVTLKNAEFIAASKQSKKPKIKVDILRTGNRSLYGDFKVAFTPDGKSNSTIVSQVKGVAVYTPNSIRHFSLNLDNSTISDFSEGTFDIVFRERSKKSSFKKQSSGINLVLP